MENFIKYILSFPNTDSKEKKQLYVVCKSAWEKCSKEPLYDFEKPIVKSIPLGYVRLTDCPRKGMFKTKKYIEAGHIKKKMIGKYTCISIEDAINCCDYVQGSREEFYP